jgi:hypothetical protein
MNIDINTLCIVALSATTLFFVGAFIRERIREKFDSIHRDWSKSVESLYSEQERMWNRVVDLENACKSRCEKYPTNHIKSHYNTEA